MRTRLIHKIMGLLSIMCIASCSSNPFFVCTENIPTEGWYSSDTIVIPIDCRAPHLSQDDFSTLHDIHFGIRTTATYAYRNLDVLVELAKNTKIIHRDTLSVTTSQQHNLFPNHAGLTIPGIKFSQRHNYSLRVSHLMRLDPLPGVSDIRIEIE